MAEPQRFTDEVVPRESHSGSTVLSKASELATDPTSRKKKRAKRKPDTPLECGSLKGGNFSMTALAAAIAAAALGTSMVMRFLRHRRIGPGGAAALLEAELPLPDQHQTASSQSLFRLRVVCSALFDIEGAHSRYSDGQTAESSAEVVIKLLEAGAQLKGRTNTEELSLGLLGDLEDATNPVALECSTSGSSCGLALVVANGLADIGLGSDHLAGIRVQSVLCGLSGFRPTQGQISGRGVTQVTGSLDTVGWLVRDPALHPKIADALKLPGATGSFSNTELLQLLVASEVFELHGAIGERLRKVALTAAKKWAGLDQVASGLLVSYLRANVPSAKSFVGYDNDNEDVLEGIRRAAVTLQYHELLQQHGHLLEEPQALKPSVLEQLERAQEVGEDEVQAAEQVAQETSKAMRAILKGTILILPSLPSPQPAQGSDVEELKKWERGVLQLAALATMSGCPQATVSILQGEGRPPLGLALLSLPKTDQRLAQVAAALGPLVQLAANSRLSTAASSGAAKPASHSKGKVGANGKIQPSEEAMAEQEALKEQGNDAFKDGRYTEAIEKYSLALKANPSNSVLYSNRAQALIKVGQFEEAERDCTKALKAGPNAKALLRRGTARASLGDTAAAAQDFKHVLALEPSNRQAKIELQNLQALGNYDDDVMNGTMIGGNGPSTARSDVSYSVV